MNIPVISRVARRLFPARLDRYSGEALNVATQAALVEGTLPPPRVDVSGGGDSRRELVY